MKLSVITINFNNRDGLRKTIESVVNQTYKDFEYIVIDGGSTDGSVDVIKEYADRIDYWVSEPDKGIYNAMNKGIDVARGEYCVFMNSGDTFYDKDVYKNVNVDLDGTDIICGNTLESNGNFVRNKKELTFKTLYNSSLCHQSVLIKTKLLKKHHYDESLKIVSDWKFFLQVIVLDNCTYKGIDILVSNYDLTGISSSNYILYDNERRSVLEDLIPKRILADINELVNGNTVEDKLYIGIKKSKFRRYIYMVNIFILRSLTIFKKNSWIRGYPLRLEE